MCWLLRVTGLPSRCCHHYLCHAVRTLARPSFGGACSTHSIRSACVAPSRVRRTIQTTRSAHLSGRAARAVRGATCSQVSPATSRATGTIARSGFSMVAAAPRGPRVGQSTLVLTCHCAIGSPSSSVSYGCAHSRTLSSIRGRCALPAARQQPPAAAPPAATARGARTARARRSTSIRCVCLQRTRASTTGASSRVGSSRRPRRSHASSRGCTPARS